MELMIQACSKYAELQASNKEKVAASSIRALGFIVQNLILLHDSQTKNPNGEQLVASANIRGYIEQIVDLIVAKLQNHSKCTPKVIWNLCVATSKFVDTFNSVHGIKLATSRDIDYEKCYLSKIFCFETTRCFLDILMNGQNYKTKIHACQTLLKFLNLSQYGHLEDNRQPQNLLRLLWQHVLEQLKYQINFDKMPSANLYSSTT